MQSPRRLRPIDQLLADTWRLLLRQWPTFLIAQGIAFALTLCLVMCLFGPYLLAAIDYAIHATHIPRHANARLIMHILFDSLLPILLIGIPIFVTTIIAGQIMKCWGLAAAVLGMAHGSAQRASPWATCFRALRMAIPLFWLGLATGLIVLGGMFWFIVPGIICALGLTLTIYICVLEGAPVERALCESWTRTRGCRLAIFGRYLLVTCVVFATLFALQIIQLFPLAGLILFPVSTVVNMLIPILYAMVGYLIYLDLRPAASTTAGATSAPMGWFIFFAISAFLPLVTATLGLAFFFSRLPR